MQYVEPKSGQPIENKYSTLSFMLLIFAVLILLLLRSVFLYHHKASAVRIQTCDPPEVEVGGEPTPPPEKPPLVKKQPQTPQIAATNNLYVTLNNIIMRKCTSYSYCTLLATGFVPRLDTQQR